MAPSHLLGIHLGEDLKTTFIGTGSAFSRRFGHSNALVECGDIRLMIDFGFLTPPRLEGFGVSLKDITHVGISHLHADHIGGLEELAFVSRFVHDQKPTLLLPPNIGPDLWNHSLRGGLEWVTDDHGDSIRCDLNSYFQTTNLGESWVDLGALAIKTFQTDHVPNKSSWGFVVRDTKDGSSMIFGCDTRARHRELLESPLSDDFANGPIFHDCRLRKSQTNSIHIRLPQISYSAAVQERIVLVHYDDDLETHLSEITAAGLRVLAPGQTIHSRTWRSDLAD